MITESTEDIIRRHDIVLRRHSTEFTKVHGTLSRLESLALEHSEQLTSLQSDMVVVKEDIAGVKADVAELKTDVAGLKTDMTEVKGSLAELLRRIPPVA